MVYQAERAYNKHSVKNFVDWEHLAGSKIANEFGVNLEGSDIERHRLLCH